MISRKRTFIIYVRHTFGRQYFKTDAVFNKDVFPQVTELIGARFLGRAPFLNH